MKIWNSANIIREVNLKRTSKKKMVQNDKYHHNKWLLYSSTVVLVSFLLVVDHISVVECGVQSLTAVENETTGKVREKAYGNSITDTNNPSSSIGGYRGKPGSNSVNVGGGGGGSVNSNELHSTKFAFNGIDEADEGDEGDSYPDEDASYAYDSDEIKGADEDYIEQYEKDNIHFGRPQLGKCCPFGEGLNVQGKCEPIDRKYLKLHDKLWFPEKVYNGKNYAATNISEWDIRVSHRLHCNDDERTEIVSDMRKFVVLNDGSLLILHLEKVIHALDFCIEQELGKGEGRVVRACFSKAELCDDRKCLRKCCPEGSISEEPHLRCDRSQLAAKYNFNNESRSILAGTPECDFGSYLTPVDGNYSISDDGSFVAADFKAPFLSYCLDYFINITEDSQRQRAPQLKAMACFERSTDSNPGGLVVISSEAAIVFGIAMILSAVCLAIAAAISWRLPELRSLHGKCQLSHLGTMFCLYVCLAIAHLGTVNIPQGLCTFIGVFIHICSLSSFLWLNLLCVNIYLTFRSLRPPLAARRDENRRLFFLCIYAWGIPAAFCCFLYILDSTYPGRLDPMPQPDYGKYKCLISNREAEFAYLFGPVGVLLLCNGLLFCLTAQELLCGLWRLDNSDSINFRRKSMGIVVAKLGIVMGLGWILDVVSWGVGKESSSMFYVVDLFNSLQGVFISVILLWRKRVLEVLHLRKPSITKDETLTARPFLAKNNSINVTSNGDHDTSMVLVNDER